MSRSGNLTRGEPSFGRDGFQQILSGNSHQLHAGNRRMYSPDSDGMFHPDDDFEFDEDEEDQQISDIMSSMFSDVQDMKTVVYQKSGKQMPSYNSNPIKQPSFVQSQTSTTPIQRRQFSDNEPRPDNLFSQTNTPVSYPLYNNHDTSQSSMPRENRFIRPYNQQKQIQTNRTQKSNYQSIRNSKGKKDSAKSDEESEERLFKFSPLTSRQDEGDGSRASSESKSIFKRHDHSHQNSQEYSRPAYQNESRRNEQRAQARPSTSQETTVRQPNRVRAPTITKEPSLERDNSVVRRPPAQPTLQILESIQKQQQVTQTDNTIVTTSQSLQADSQPVLPIVQRTIQLQCDLVSLEKVQKQSLSPFETYNLKAISDIVNNLNFDNEILNQNVDDLKLCIVFLVQKNKELQNNYRKEALNRDLVESYRDRVAELIKEKDQLAQEVLQEKMKNYELVQVMAQAVDEQKYWDGQSEELIEQLQTENEHLRQLLAISEISQPSTKEIDNALSNHEKELQNDEYSKKMEKREKQFAKKKVFEEQVRHAVEERSIIMEKSIRDALDDEYRQRQEQFDEQEAALIQELMREQQKNTSGQFNLDPDSKESTPDKVEDKVEGSYGEEDEDDDVQVNEQEEQNILDFLAQQEQQRNEMQEDVHENDEMFEGDDDIDFDQFQEDQLKKKKEFLQNIDNEEEFMKELEKDFASPPPADMASSPQFDTGDGIVFDLSGGNDDEPREESKEEEYDYFGQNENTGNKEDYHIMDDFEDGEEEEEMDDEERKQKRENMLQEFKEVLEKEEGTHEGGSRSRYSF